MWDEGGRQWDEGGRHCDEGGSQVYDAGIRVAAESQHELLQQGLGGSRGWGWGGGVEGGGWGQRVLTDARDRKTLSKQQH